MNMFVYRKLISSLTTSNLYYPKPHFLISLSHLNYFFSTKTQKPDSSAVEDCLINKHGFSPEAASKASPFITRARNPENSYSVITFLGENGFSTTNIQKIVGNLPSVLTADVDNIIKPKIKLFKDIGFSSDELAKVIASHPDILQRSADKRLLPSIATLKRILGADLSVCKVIKQSGYWVVKEDLEKTMIPNIEFLVSRGISRTQITKMVFSWPRFFMQKPDGFEDSVKRVEELGLNCHSKSFRHAIRILGSMSREIWERKLELLRSFGLSEDQIFSMFRKSPQVFAVSHQKIKDAAEFLLSTGRCDITLFVVRPETLAYNLEGRTKPRFRILEILEKKNLISRQPTLSTYLTISNKVFFEKYVSLCDDEAGKIFTLATKAARSWKLIEKTLYARTTAQ